MGNMGTIKQAIAFPATKTQSKLDLTIGERDRIKGDIEIIVKEVLDIIPMLKVKFFKRLFKRKKQKLLIKKILNL